MNILIFGGNGFLGSATVQQILSKKLPSRHIFLVNRGHWPWSSKVDIKPNVTFVYCDRKKSLVQNKQLTDVTDNTYFDFVIDFSAYSKKTLSPSIDLLEGKVGLYIFISSDSVYEVCDITHSLPSKETDSVRPVSLEKQKVLKKQDSYGHKKLECEELLQMKFRQTGMKYLILRLADIIGPKDSTDRWWTYQLWVELNQKLEIPVLLPSELEKKELSFVYSQDVANLISKILLGDIDNHLIHNEIYNLACQEVIQLDEFITEIKSNLCKNQRKCFRFSKSSDVPWIFPSVSRGPVNISKATTYLGWKPKPINEVIKETVKFYKEIQSSQNYTKEKEEIIDAIVEDLTPLFKDVDIRKELENIVYENIYPT